MAARRFGAAARDGRGAADASREAERQDLLAERGQHGARASDQWRVHARTGRRRAGPARAHAAAAAEGRRLELREDQGRSAPRMGGIAAVATRPAADPDCEHSGLCRFIGLHPQLPPLVRRCAAPLSPAVVVAQQGTLGARAFHASIRWRPTCAPAGARACDLHARCRPLDIAASHEHGPVP